MNEVFWEIPVLKCLNFLAINDVSGFPLNSFLEAKLVSESLYTLPYALGVYIADFS